jgi:hypothetical protein
MDALTIILSSISIVNILVLSTLILILTKSYLKTRAQFPLYMIVFCGFLVLHNYIGALAYFSVGELFSGMLFPYLLGIHTAELGGLLVFLKLSLE